MTPADYQPDSLLAQKGIDKVDNVDEVDLADGMDFMYGVDSKETLS